MTDARCPDMSATQQRAPHVWWECRSRCMLAQAGEYDWTVHVLRRCGLLSNYFDHLVIYLVCAGTFTLTNRPTIITIIKTTSECEWRWRHARWLAGDGGRGRSGRGLHTLRTVSASQEQTLSGRGARVYTAHRGWLGVVTGINAASTGVVLVYAKSTVRFRIPTSA